MGTVARGRGGVRITSGITGIAAPAAPGGAARVRPPRPAAGGAAGVVASRVSVDPLLWQLLGLLQQR